MKKQIKTLMLALALAGCGTSAALALGFKDGVEYFKADQFENAQEILQRNLDLPGTDKALSHYYLGAIDMVNKDKGAAKANFDKGVAANPDCPYNYVGLGALDLQAGNTSAAKSNFDRAQSLAKKDAAISVLIARAYYNADPVKYAKDVEKYLAKASKESKLKEPSIYILEGDMLMDNKQVGDAAAKYENAIYYDEGNSEGYVKYANAYFQVNPNFAVQKLEELLAKQPQSALAQRELAEKYYENSQWLKASDLYGQYIKNPNHFPQDVARYAFLLFYGEKYPQSLEVAESLLAQDPNHFLMNRIKMLDLEKLGRLQEAKEAAQKFFTLNGYYTGNDYATYSNILKELGEGEAGVAVMEEGAKRLPDNPAIHQALSQTYAGAKRYFEAAEAMDRYINARGEEVTVTDLFGAAGRYLSAAATTAAADTAAMTAARGVAYVEKALEQQPNNPSLWRRKAQLHMVGNNKEMNQPAVDAYLKLVELLDLDPEAKNVENPNNSIDYYKNAYLMLGLYYDGQGDKDSATKYFEQYFALDPANEAVRQYLGR